MSPVIYQLLLIIHVSSTNTASIISMIFPTVLINLTVINVIVNLVITIAFKFIISKLSIVIIIKYW